MVLNTNGTIQGTPSGSGYNSNYFVARATDRNGCAGDRAYSITVCPVITVDPPTIPNGTNGVAYARSLTASGGAPPYQFSISAGALPAGLTLDANGFLSSTSAPCGRFKFTVKATDANNCAGYRYYEFVFSSPNCPQWIEATPLPGRYSSHSMVYSGGFLYQTGGTTYDGGTDDAANVFYAQVHTNGTIGSWSPTTPLPERVYDHAGIANNGFLYVLGGFHSTLANGDQLSGVVYYSKLNVDRSVGAWQTANPLPYAFAFSAAAIWKNHIYISAGFSQNGATNAVYAARIQADGSLAAWMPQTPMPVVAYTHASVANGVLYVIGGFNDGGSALVKKVYFSRINADGTLGGWNLTTPLPYPVGDFEAVAANGRIFTMGGSNGASPVDDCHSATVNGDGSLGPWSAGFRLPQPLFFHASAVSDSHIFVSGGGNPVILQNAVYSISLPPPPAPPTLTTQSLGTNGNFQLQLASDTNTGFGFLASTNLTHWERIGWGFTGTNGLLTFPDTNAASFPRRYYRAAWPLP